MNKKPKITARFVDSGYGGQGGSSYTYCIYEEMVDDKLKRYRLLFNGSRTERLDMFYDTLAALHLNLNDIIKAEFANA